MKRLIAFIDEYTGAKPPKTRKRPRKQRAGKPSLLEVIGERPGVRTTMLAMVTGREVDEVAERLARHKEGGEIERDGLGWRLRH